MNDALSPTPQQQAANTGVDLAWQANDALDAYNRAERDRLQLDSTAQIPGVAIGQEAYDAVDQRVEDNKKLFDGLMNGAGALIGRDMLGAGEFSDKLNKTKMQLEAEKRRELFHRAGALSDLAAEKFGVDRKDFVLVSILSDPEDQSSRKLNVLGYSGDTGVDLATSNTHELPNEARKWESIMDPNNNELFMVEHDGTKFDTRSGATHQVLTALAARNPKINEWVWLTGERVTDDPNAVPIAALSGGKLTDQREHPLGAKTAGIYFRPAFVID